MTIQPNFVYREIKPRMQVENVTKSKRRQVKTRSIETPKTTPEHPKPPQNTQTTSKPQQTNLS